MVTVLRPLSTSELLDRTFHLYRNNFVVFVTIAAIPQLAVLALQLLIARLALGNIPGEIGLWSLPVSLLSLVCVGVSEAGTVVAVSNVHLDHPVSVWESFRAIRGSIGRVVWVSFAISWIIGFGLILLIIPGIYWALKYALAIPVTVLEGSDLAATRERSGYLTQDRMGRIFVIYALLLLLTFVVGTCIDMAFRLGTPWHVDVTFTALRYTLAALSNFLSSSLVTPLLTIALTLIYYDERVRKEGFDLQLMMSTLEGQPHSVAAAPAS